MTPRVPGGGLAPDDDPVRPAADGAVVARRPVDARALQRVRERLERGPSPWLHGEVARRMAERLALIRQPPREALDWWPRGGGGTDALVAAARGARVSARDADGTGTVGGPPRWWTPARWRRSPAAAIGGARCDLLWANMLLQWSDDPPTLLRLWHEALAVDGYLMFSTVGPGTLEALREIHRAAGWGPPFAPFVDMHDVGDMLVAAGFADPVMDQETLTLTWADGDAALVELHTLGSNVDPARHPGLRTRRWRDALASRLPRGADGRVALRFEIVYGHAVRVAPRPRLAAETTVDLQDMRSILRGRRER